MKKYLIKSAWEMVRSDGIKTTLEQTGRYIGLYGSPFKILKYWTMKLSGISGETIKDIQGSKMILDLKSNGIHIDLYLNGIREPLCTRYLQSILKPEWTVCEAGANVGYYALIEARVVKEVIAIEPEPTNFSYLYRNKELNNYKNITLHNVAVGDETGTTKFTLSKASNWHRIAAEQDEGLPSINVPLVTLDSLVWKRVDFLRMDVEGYEMNILLGATKLLERSRPLLFLEVHRDFLKHYNHTQWELLSFLATLGYHIKKSYILGREGPIGSLKDLLLNDKTRKLITKRGIASWFFLEVPNA